MNTHTMKHQVQKGFTLVELLIVVIILAILAAIVVPQFASSTDDAKMASLTSNLANLRSATDLYYQQHGAYPGEKLATGGTCPVGGSAPAAGAVGKEAFIAQMTLFTNAAGQACTKSDSDFKYGPYMKTAQIPANPITDSDDLDVVGNGVLGMTGVADPFATTPAKAWKYDYLTGQFIINDNRAMPGSTTKYDQL